MRFPVGFQQREVFAQLRIPVPEFAPVAHHRPCDGRGQQQACQRGDPDSVTQPRLAERRFVGRAVSLFQLGHRYPLPCLVERIALADVLHGTGIGFAVLPATVVYGRGDRVEPYVVLVEAFDVRQRAVYVVLRRIGLLRPVKNDGRSDVVERAVIVVGRCGAVCQRGCPQFVHVDARPLFEQLPGAPVFGEGVVYQVLQGDLLGEETECHRVARPDQRGECFDGLGIATAGILCRREHVTAVSLQFPTAGLLCRGDGFRECLLGFGVVSLFEVQQPQRVVQRHEQFCGSRLVAVAFGIEHRLRVAFDRPSQVAGIVVYLCVEIPGIGTLGPGAVALVIIQCGCGQRILVSLGTCAGVGLREQQASPGVGRR